LDDISGETVSNAGIHAHLEQHQVQQGAITFCGFPRSGKYDGPEAERLAALKWAAMLGAAYVDVELEAAKFFFGGPAP
jgi:3-dehydroquinate dehydratase